MTKEAKDIVTKLELEDRVFNKTKQDAFQTVKDHKPNFKNNPTSCLINPTKPELGRVSKKLLSKVVAIVRKKSGLTQWKNTYELLAWYNNLPDKHKANFISFNICSFYPSITEELLRKAIDHAGKYVQISDEEKEILFHTSKSLLYHKGEAWAKKGVSLFDIGMGSYDGAEKCDLVGLYLLSLLQHLKLKLGLFRDDGLAVSYLTKRENQNVKKEICKIFRQEGLEITITANLKVVEFLDVELDLSTGTHKPYTKPNNTILYVDASSNHPQSIKKNIPLACQKRLSLLSSNRDIFESVIPPYQEALNRAGHQHKLVYQPKIASNTSRKRVRSKPETWFNPPYSQNVKANVGAEFLKIIDSSFPKGHPLHEIFKRSTIKVSYRTTGNMAQVISRHNKQILKKAEPSPTKVTKECNCQKANLPCIMGGKCVQGCVVYQGAVTRHDTGQVDFYTGLSEPSWKLRWGNHKANFKTDTQANRTATCLPKHIRKLKDKNVTYSIQFKQLALAPAYNPVTRTCCLCLTEKISQCTSQKEPP